MHVSRIRAGFVVAFMFGAWSHVDAAPPRSRGDAPVDRQATKPPPTPPPIPALSDPPPTRPPIPALPGVPPTPPPTPTLPGVPPTPPPPPGLYEILPSPEAAIPDDPPPHEGALFELPYVIETPDLLIVEVLEALPGRPITGEHLVRQDGTIGLGFYGDVHVQGISMQQAKVKIIAHLRRTLADDVLGLIRFDGSVDDDDAGEGGNASQDLFDLNPPKEVDPSLGPREKPASRVGRGAHERSVAQRERRLPRPQASPHRRSTATSATRVQPAQVRKSVDGEKNAPEAANPGEGTSGPSKVVVVLPKDSLAVYVDVAAYNSKFYFVQGDSTTTGRFPWTGRDTVLDAIQHAGGLIPTADPRNIRLVRPARGDKKAHVYPIDLQAIVEKGDKTANLQLFPGDRLVVGRDALVKTTIAVDRAAASIQSALASIRLASAVERALFPPTTRSIARLQIGGLTWTLEAGGEEKSVTAAQREETIKSWVEFWSKAAARASGADGDDALLREALLRHLIPSATVPRDNRN